jgi:hydroxymethylpyrimidine/phosphomethylpyrimidine kinase
MTEAATVPVVLVFAGHDPSGGAGIQADIEAIVSMGCHAATVVTALTVQDTADVQRFVPVDAMLVLEQARAVLEDLPVGAIKIGMVGSVDNVEVIHSILVDYPQIPVVLDPVMASGGGTGLADDDVVAAIVELLFPLATLATPNSLEVRALAPEADDLDACAHQILESGCEYLLVTGTHENTPDVVNVLYSNLRRLDEFRWPRLPSSYHGSGCTLASAIAGLFAQGMEPFTAIREAQEYTHETLKHGYRIGMGQHLPNRLFWAQTYEAGHEAHKTDE